MLYCHRGSFSAAFLMAGTAGIDQAIIPLIHTRITYCRNTVSVFPLLPPTAHPVPLPQALQKTPQRPQFKGGGLIVVWTGSLNVPLVRPLLFYDAQRASEWPE